MRDGLHLRLRGGNRNAGFHAPEKTQEKRAPILKPFITGRPDPAVHRQWYPNVRRDADIDASKPWRCHPDNGKGATV